MPVSTQPAGRDSPLQRELLEEFRALKPIEVQNRIMAHLGSSWERGKERHRANLLSHFEKHAETLGVQSIKDYKDLTYSVIKEPQMVFVQRNQNSTDYVFVKDGVIVVSNDDLLLIKSVYRLKMSIEEWLKDAERKGRTTIRIL